MWRGLVVEKFPTLLKRNRIVLTSNSKLPERRHTDKKGVQKDEEESEHNVKKKCMVDLPLKTFLC